MIQHILVKTIHKFFIVICFEYFDIRQKQSIEPHIKNMYHSLSDIYKKLNDNFAALFLPIIKAKQLPVTKFTIKGFLIDEKCLFILLTQSLEEIQMLSQV
jgi:hypothetical protein